MHWLVITLIIFPSSIKKDSQNNSSFIIWNVGQGLWTTFKSNEQCFHFDIGGEKLPNLNFLNSCKIHKIFLSHLDQDHISFSKKLKNSCIVPLSNDQIKFYNTTQTKQNFIQKSVFCDENNNLENLTEISLDQKDYNKPIDKMTNNEISRIFILNKKILLPGDSPIKSENLWSKKYSHNLESIKFWLLGHHGSRTSNGSNLLASLPKGVTAITSARFEKYKHPHSEVILNLKTKKIPNLKTEDWGSIAIEI